MKYSEEIKKIKAYFPVLQSYEELKRVLEESFQIGAPVMLWGHSGVGKTTMVYNFARENNFKLYDIKLSQRSPVSVAGLFYPDSESGVTVRFPAREFDEIHKLVKEGQNVLLFFDELLHANPDVVAGVWELILEKKLDHLKFDGGLHIVAAANPDEKKIQLFSYKALFNRFRHFIVLPNAESVADYISKTTGCSHVASFLRARPDLLLVEGELFFKATPRAWERVARSCELKIGYDGYLSDDITSLFKNCFEIFTKMKSVGEYLQNPTLFDEFKDDLDRAMIIWNFIYQLQLSQFDNFSHLEKVGKYLVKKFGKNNMFSLSLFSLIKSKTKKISMADLEKLMEMLGIEF